MQKWQRHFRSILFVVTIIAISSLSFYTQAAKKPVAKQIQSRASQAASNQPQQKFRKVSKPIPNSYIVVFTNGITGQRIEMAAIELARTHKGIVKFVYQYALNGFAVQMVETEALSLSKNPLVEYVEEDGEARITETQPNPPWGLDRIDQRNLPLNQTYTFQSTGQNVHVYVIDSGIRDTHQEFGGRATRDADFVGDGQNGNDCLGHGTHVAGTVGGSTVGVAKNARIHAIRVFGCGLTSSDSVIIAGINWVAANYISPAVANLSLGGPASDAVDSATRNLINVGVTSVISAGNGGADEIGDDAITVSPARVVEAITVGATNPSDSRTGFSNYGAVVDLFAPGASIQSAYISNDTSYAYFSGTSQAAPHVTGVVARYLQLHLGVSPAMVQDAIKAAATAGVVIDPGPGSPNRLLYSTVEASVVYVDQANVTGVEDGTLQFPFRTLGAGVSALFPGGTIIIQPGTYSGVGLYSKPMSWTAPSGNVILN